MAECGGAAVLSVVPVVTVAVLRVLTMVDVVVPQTAPNDVV